MKKILKRNYIDEWPKEENKAATSSKASFTKRNKVKIIWRVSSFGSLFLEVYLMDN
jgi:hypothetical protein